MDTKSKFDMAKKYEFYSMMADAQNNKELANRYSSLSRQAMFDALNSYSRDSINNTRSEHKVYYAPKFDSDDFKSFKDWVPIIISSLFLIGVYCIGSIM